MIYHNSDVNFFILCKSASINAELKQFLLNFYILKDLYQKRLNIIILKVNPCSKEYCGKNIIKYFTYVYLVITHMFVTNISFLIWVFKAKLELNFTLHFKVCYFLKASLERLICLLWYTRWLWSDFFLKQFSSAVYNKRQQI